jgi:hypothetical protein
LLHEVALRIRHAYEPSRAGRCLARALGVSSSPRAGVRKKEPELAHIALLASPFGRCNTR